MQVSFDSRGWYHAIVTERNISFSDFMATKMNNIHSDFPHEREEGIRQVVEVIGTFPGSFLQKREVSLLLDFFVVSLDSTALAGGSAIRGIHSLIFNSENLPEGFESPLFCALFRDGSVQSWTQKERILLYEILHWFITEKKSFLKSVGSDFLSSYLKSVSGERDPRCLVHLFSTFIEVTKSFPLGPFTEDMFETVACYFPIQFKPKPNDTISREYLTATCASCLVSYSFFAPFCFMFIDEKLKEDHYSEEEYTDIFNLLALACVKFPPQSSLDHLEPLFDDFRQISLNPKNERDISKYILPAFESLLKFSCLSSMENSTPLENILISLLENSEPFILQAEMGLCKNALDLLRCAFQNNSGTCSEKILSQVFSWILNLVSGDSASTAPNKVEIIQQGLGYLDEWVHLAAHEKHSSNECLIVFEQSVFDSCVRAKKFTSTKAITTIYQCATVYLRIGCASSELLHQCDEWVSSSLSSVVNREEFDLFLIFISAYSSFHLDRIKQIITETPFANWDENKRFEVLCSIGSRHDGWIFVKNLIIDEIKEHLLQSKQEFDLSCYENMMRLSINDDQLLMEQFKVLEDLIFKTHSAKYDLLAQCLQSVALLLTPKSHAEFMKEITSRYSLLSASEIHKFDSKYRLVYLQNMNSADLCFAAKKNISKTSVRQFCFASINKSQGTEITFHLDEVAELKAHLLKGSEDSKGMFESYLKNLHFEPGKSDNIKDFSFLYDFESSFANPLKCRYETGSPLWRQRIFCQIVPIFKKVFDESTERNVFVEMLPHFLNFAMPLDSKQLNSQFEMLLPVLIGCISSEAQVHSNVAKAIPMLLKFGGLLSAEDLFLIINYVCSVLRAEYSIMGNLEDALLSLNILVSNQPSEILLPNAAQVVRSATKLLSHKKRLLRKLAADVKNNWEVYT